MNINVKTDLNNKFFNYEQDINLTISSVENIESLDETLKVSEFNQKASNASVEDVDVLTQLIKGI